jgi:lysozyme
MWGDPRMNISEKGIQFIKRFEGKFLRAYYCPAGVLTIGYGHTNLSGFPPKVYPGMVITEAQADEMLRKVLDKVYEAAVRKLVRVPLTQHQYDALVSFVYNVGESNFRKSGVLRAVNSKNYAAVPGLLMQWTKANGRVLKGLVNRRQQEGILWNSKSGPYTPPAPKPSPDMPQDVDNPDVKKGAFWRQIAVILGTVTSLFTGIEYKEILAVGVVGIAAYAVWVASGKPRFWRGEF